MKEIKVLIIFLVPVAICLLSSCAKSNQSIPEPATQYVVFNQEGFKYIRLPLNRYFLYKDSASAEIDSVVVTKSLWEKIFHPSTPPAPGGIFSGSIGIPAFYAEAFTLILTKVNNGAPVEWFHGRASAGYPDQFSNTTKIAPIELKEQYPFPVFFAPGGVVIDSLRIEGRVYHDVRQYSTNNGLQSSNPNYSAGVFLWAKDVGIIKVQRIKNTGNKTYTLVRHG